MANLFKVVNDELILMSCGTFSEAVSWNEDGTVKDVIGDRPVLGYSMHVGNALAAFSAMGECLTTEVIKIISEKPNTVRFLTESGVYEWRKSK
jgi:hypothetical protein